MGILVYLWCVCVCAFVVLLVADIVHIRRGDLYHWTHIAMTAVGFAVTLLGATIMFLW
jgi:Mn2+/Fe2+ NRAMP family transporter